MNNYISGLQEFINHNNEGMIDGDRIMPVEYLVIHHSAGAEMINASDLEVMDYFDKAGENRGYETVRKKKGLKEIRSYHSHPKLEKETYAQAHFALHVYNLDSNPYGWRLVPLICRPFENVTWHAGNWKINQKSIGIEICGNYEKRKIDHNALILIADTFKFWYNNLKKQGLELKVRGHRDFANTACPGMIYDQLDIIRDNLKK